MQNLALQKSTGQGADRVRKVDGKTSLLLTPGLDPPTPTKK